MHKILIWDFPTRLFHWLLVLALAFQFTSAELLDDVMTWHFYGGYFTLGLIVFRLMWGLVGATYARFSNFMVSPAHALQYAKTLAFHDTSVHAGHNPMGAYAIVAILSIVLTQAVSGLFVSDEIFHSGPYYDVASPYWQDLANWLHHNLFNAIWVFLIFHLGAMLFYKIEKQQDLVLAMFSGYKHLPYYSDATKHHWLRFVICASLAALFVWGVVVWWAPEIVDNYY